MKFYGQFNNPRVDEYIYNRFFSHNPRGGCVIEAGAEDGSTIPNSKFFEEYLGWNVINVEADPLMYNKLINRRPKSTNLHKALVHQDKSGQTLDFQMYNVGIGYVIDEVPEIHKEFTKQVAGNIHKKLGVSKVDCISYRDLINSLGLVHVDLLVLDIEGSELSVLESLTTEDVLPSVMCIEDNLGEQAAFDECLFKLGYKFDKKVHVNLHYYLD